MWISLSQIGIGAIVTSVIVLLGSFFVKDNLNDKPPLGYIRNNKSYSVVVYGSSGAIGRSSVKEFAKSDLCHKIGAVVRTKNITQNGNHSDNNHNNDNKQKNILFADGLTDSQLDKIHIIQVNYDKLNESKYLKEFDNAVCALGTTIRTAGSSEKFREVDFTYVLNSANISLKNGVKHFSLVTSMGADHNSFLLYPKTKGQAEEECKKVGFDKLSIFRPALLLTSRNESRPFERLAQVVYPHFHWILNIFGLSKYKAVHVDRVAQAVRWNIEKQEEINKLEIFENGDILQLDVSKKKIK